MSVRELMLSLVRRWYLILVGVLVTAGLATALLLTIPATYETKSTVLLLPPESSVGTRGNPYLYLGGLAQAVEVLSYRMNTTQIRDPIETAHPDAEFDIGQDPQATGPILAVTVTSSTAADAQQVTQQLLVIAQQTLASMQDQLDIPGTSRIGSLVLTPDAKIEKVTKSRDRGVLAATGAGLALTVLATGLIDGLLLGRIAVRRRRPDPDRFIAPTRAETQTAPDLPATRNDTAAPVAVADPTVDDVTDPEDAHPDDPDTDRFDQELADLQARMTDSRSDQPTRTP